MEALIAWLVIVNVFGLAIMGIDKAKAQTDKRRIPERTLFFVAVVGGSLGVLAGMYIFRHKTRHKKFTIGIPVIIVLQLIALKFVLGGGAE
ncbi:MAG: DUF1294 domain-containing protein [Oscillospiraceae bacterium]|nr:DUF1294 domain-containing protein [Oscillospiraceae bacterium]